MLQVVRVESFRIHRRVEALGHSALGYGDKAVHHLVEGVLDLGSEHHLHHEVEVGFHFDMEIGLVLLSVVGVEMKVDRESERSAVVLNRDLGIWYPVGDDDSDLEALNSGRQGVIVRHDILFLVLRKHLEEIAHVHERHVQHVWSTGHNAVLACVFFHIKLFLLSPGGRAEPPLTEYFVILFTDVAAFFGFIHKGCVI